MRASQVPWITTGPYKMTDSPECSQRSAARSRIWAAGSFGDAAFTTDGLLAVADLIDRFRARRDGDRDVKAITP